MLSRRSFVKLMAIATLLPLGGGLLYLLRFREFPIKSLFAEEKQVIRVLVDLILPRDELAPGAIDLDVDTEILDIASDDHNLRRLLKQGIRWLDAQAAGSGIERFLSLSNAQRIALLESAEMADLVTIENQLFRRLRDLTFEHYYTKPQAWPGLCYPGPPQPLGFMDYQSPPQECDSGA